MHVEMEHFITVVKDELPNYFTGVSVLEIGSYDVNGSVRKFFVATKEFVGVDVIPGPGVDVVGSGHDLSLGRSFDVAISAECFEHNPHYFETFENMVRHTKPGGLIVFTCASTGRPEHGTSRSEPESSPGTVRLGWNYYKNLASDDFKKFPFAERFEGWRFYENRNSHDLYFVGLKKNRDRKISLTKMLDRIGDAILGFAPTRNSLCACGSGKRFKHCHGRLA